LLSKKSSVNRYKFVRCSGIFIVPSTKVTKMPSVLGQKINERRRELGMSLEKLAAETESSKSYLWELENRDKPNPSADKVTKIAAVLGVTAQYLMDQESGSPDRAVRDEAFFRKYKQLTDANKMKLESVLDVFSREN